MSSFDKAFEILAELQALEAKAAEKQRELYRALVYREQESLYGFPPLPAHPRRFRDAIAEARIMGSSRVDVRGHSMTLRYAELLKNEKP